MIMEIEPAAAVSDNIVSIVSGIKWLKENETPTLLYQTSSWPDGLSFEILKQLMCTVL